MHQEVERTFSGDNGWHHLFLGVVGFVRQMSDNLMQGKIRMRRLNRLFISIFCLLPLLACPCFPLDANSSAQNNSEREGKDELLTQVWDGVQKAQSRYLCGCGQISETRTSKLLSKPLFFRGRFCASGKEKFQLVYWEPEFVRLAFNQGFLNVTTGKENKTTEVFKIADAVEKTQRHFSRADSIRNLKKDFDIKIQESPSSYTMKLVPRSSRFKQKINYIIVVLGKSDFLLQTLEVDGKSGVNSVFSIEVGDLNTKIDDNVFKVYLP